MHLVAALLLASTATTSAVPLKCRSTVPMPGYEANEPVVLVDGRLTPRSPEAPSDRGEAAAFKAAFGLDPEDVHSIAVTCWRPESNTFGTGAGPTVGVVRIHTKPAMRATRAPLEALVRAQEAYVGANGHAAARLDDLRMYGLANHAGLRYDVTDDGWTASTPDDRVAWQCTASSPADDGSAIVCDTRDGLGLASMRERFESASDRTGGPSWTGRSLRPYPPSVRSR